MSHLRPRWLVSALLLTAACGGGDPELPPVYRHVSLRPPETELELPGTTIWRRFDVLRERPDWKVTAGRSNVIGITQGRTVTSVLWLAEPVGDPFDPARFNQRHHGRTQ